MFHNLKHPLMIIKGKKCVLACVICALVPGCVAPLPLLHVALYANTFDPSLCCDSGASFRPLLLCLRAEDSRAAVSLVVVRERRPLVLASEVASQ